VSTGGVEAAFEGGVLGDPVDEGEGPHPPALPATPASAHAPAVSPAGRQLALLVSSADFLAEGSVLRGLLGQRTVSAVDTVLLDSPPELLAAAADTLGLAVGQLRAYERTHAALAVQAVCLPILTSALLWAVGPGRRVRGTLALSCQQLMQELLEAPQGAVTPQGAGVGGADAGPAGPDDSVGSSVADPALASVGLRTKCDDHPALQQARVILSAWLDHDRKHCALERLRAFLDPERVRPASHTQAFLSWAVGRPVVWRAVVGECLRLVVASPASTSPPLFSLIAHVIRMDALDRGSSGEAVAVLAPALFATITTAVDDSSPTALQRCLDKLTEPSALEAVMEACRALQVALHLQCSLGLTTVPLVPAGAPTAAQRFFLMAEWLRRASGQACALWPTVAGVAAAMLSVQQASGPATAGLGAASAAPSGGSTLSSPSASAAAASATPFRSPYMDLTLTILHGSRAEELTITYAASVSVLRQVWRAHARVSVG
jgi:hypothetical protein